ncbi:unnamed protein product [Paramecium sonneborni]|uniref:Tudor-knot domain-containing protein n=1 Tax=Paramecium sonneborni TaxID=65129 RepID=A0A8S1KBT8_9CILI|nr:unnamed protein product [Paramecium sonneborni]
MGIYLEAQVQSVEQNRIFIHYNGWGNRWDEWIDIQSPRIAIFRTYTVGSINQEFLSPNPVSDPDCEVEKQEIDMHKFIFDVGHMMNQVTQQLIEFGRYTNNKRIAEKQLQLQQQYQQMFNNKNKEVNIDENNLEIKRKEKELNEYEIKSSLIGSQLAPIFDRMGRMMTDLAPHLALMGSKTQRMNNNNNQQQLLFQVPVTLTPNEIYQSQQNAPTLHSRLEIISNRLAILRMTEYIQQEESDDDHRNNIIIITYNILIQSKEQNQTKFKNLKQQKILNKILIQVSIMKHFLDNKFLFSEYRINYTLQLVLISYLFSNQIDCPFISFMKQQENPYSEIKLWPLQYCLLCAIVLFTNSIIQVVVLLKLDQGGIFLVRITQVVQCAFYFKQQIKDIYTILIILLCFLSYISSLYYIFTLIFIRFFIQLYSADKIY